MQPLLNILDYQPANLSFAPISGFDANLPQRAQISSTFTLFRTPDDPQKFKVLLGCRLFKQNEDENIPYVTEFTLSGEFWSALPLDQRGIPERVVNNAIMILYGVARGIVGQSTAGGIHGRFVLPAVTFDEMVSEATKDPSTSVIPDEATPQPPRRTRPK